ncbi:hypothetical protein LTR95_000758 [Oleoguttula sp. CCFEE 5521]
MRFLTLIKLVTLTLGTLIVYRRCTPARLTTLQNYVTRHCITGTTYLHNVFSKRYMSVMSDNEYTLATHNTPGLPLRTSQPWPGEPALSSNNSLSSIRIAPARECGMQLECLRATPGISQNRVMKIKYSEDSKVRESTCTLGFNTVSSDSLDRWPNRLLYKPSFLNELDQPATSEEDQAYHEWYEAINEMTLAHEVGHCLGLLHEHQRPGVYDAWGASNPSLKFSPQYIRNYSKVLDRVNRTSETEVPEFRGLVGPERMYAVIANPALTETYWDSQTDVLGVYFCADIDTDAGVWAPIADSRMRTVSYAAGGPVDTMSVMIYSGYVNAGSMKGVKGPKGWIIRDLRSSRENPNMPGGREYENIFQCGVEHASDCTGPSAGDVARVLALYPVATHAERRAVHVGRGASVEPPYQPMVVTIGNVMRTVRPVPRQTHFTEADADDDYSSFPPGLFSTKSFDDMFN